MSSESSEEDAFMNAVELAKSTFDAKKKCEEANHHVKLIEEYYQQAKEEYLRLQDVAAGLASTATAVASVALKVCAYSSYKEAFSSSHKYSEKMSYDEFIATISSNESRKGESKGKANNGMMEENDEFVVAQVQHKEPRSPPGKVRGGKTTFNHSQKDYDSHKFLNRTGKEKLSSSKNPFKHQHTPFDLVPGQVGRRSSLPADATLFASFNSDKSLSELGSSSSKDFASEKFPKQVTPSDYKESLEETFHTSITSMTPLWEDRYTDPSKNKTQDHAHGHGTLHHDPSTWSEKKSLKQFQIKLKHVNPVDSKVDENDPWRPDNPTPIDNPRLLTPYSPTTSSRRPSDDGSDEESFDDAREALDFQDTKEPELSKLFNMKLVSNVRNVEGRQMDAQRLNIPAASIKRPVSPLLKKEEIVHYGVVKDECSCNQERHIFQPRAHNSDGGN